MREQRCFQQEHEIDKDKNTPQKSATDSSIVHKTGAPQRKRESLKKASNPRDYLKSEILQSYKDILEIDKNRDLKPVMIETKPK